MSRKLPNLEEQERMVKAVAKRYKFSGAKPDHCRVPGLMWVSPQALRKAKEQCRKEERNAEV